MSDAVWLMLVAATGGVVASLVRVVATARARRYVQPVDVRMACPVSGNDVDCTLLLDERSGRFRAVERCARFTPGLDESGGEGEEGGEAPPRSERSRRCEHRCVELLNIGIPLRPSSGPPAPDDGGNDDDDDGGAKP